MPRRFRVLPLGLTALAVLAGATATARAAEPASPPMIEGLLAQARAEVERVFMSGEGLDFADLDLGAERIVKGAPYCAEAQHETVQWLPDGAGAAPNRITRQSVTRLCRDGEGRTRQEVERGGRRLVYLRDPVAKENWVLDPERRTARRLAGVGDAAALGEQLRQRLERVRIGQPPVPPVAPAAPVSPVAPVAPVAPPTPVFIDAPDAPASGARTRSETRVIRIQRDGAPAQEWTLPPVAVQWRAQTLAPRGPGSAQPLGTRELEGLRAHGERTTWTIEAGRVGNEKPIVITREVWTAPDLMVTVSSRDFDPRSGETNYRLKGVKRGEPDASLMRVPADFSKPAPRPAPRASGATG